MAFGSINVRHIFLTKGLHLEGTLTKTGRVDHDMSGELSSHLCDGFTHCVEFYVVVFALPSGRVMFRFSVDTDSCIWEMANFFGIGPFLYRTSFGLSGPSTFVFFSPDIVLEWSSEYECVRFVH